MAVHLQRMAAHAPNHYDFFPTTFVLPADLPALLADAQAAGQRQAYILKPDAGCQVRAAAGMSGTCSAAVAAGESEAAASTGRPDLPPRPC
jgi:tubulin polyglutamylase TTLL6/13